MKQTMPASFQRLGPTRGELEARRRWRKWLPWLRIVGVLLVAALVLGMAPRRPLLLAGLAVFVLLGCLGREGITRIANACVAAWQWRRKWFRWLRVAGVGVAAALVLWAAPRVPMVLAGLAAFVFLGCLGSEGITFVSNACVAAWQRRRKRGQAPEQARALDTDGLAARLQQVRADYPAEARAHPQPTPRHIGLLEGTRRQLSRLPFFRRADASSEGKARER